MELPIHDISVDRFSKTSRPKAAETLVVLMAAFGARPVAGGERSPLVKKEELGVRVRPHDDAMAAAEFYPAREPASHLRIPHHAPIFIVQDSAIAHDQAAPLKRDDVAKWRYPVL
jgi:hypothetical protein